MKALVAVAALCVLFAGQAQASKQRSTPFPPHHALWVCIAGHEAGWHDHGPGHYGGLQMTWNWMRLIPGDAGDLSQAQQEWAAEKAWSQNNYRYSFLYGQWYAWDNADGCGTTG